MHGSIVYSIPQFCGRTEVYHHLFDVVGSNLFHAGTAVKDGQVVTNGGRVIAVSSYGDTQLEALATSFKNAQALHFTDMYCRSDIGKDIL